MHEGFMIVQSNWLSMSRTRNVGQGIRRWLPWAAVALAAGFAAVAGSSLAVGFRPAFVVTPFDRLVVAYTPDAVVNFAITQLQELGHLLAFGTAVALAGVVLAGTAVPGVLALHDGRPAAGVLLGAVLPGLGAVAATASLSSGAGAAAAAGAVALVAALVARRPGPTGEDASVARRQVLGALGTAAGVGTLAWLRRPGGTGATPDVVEAPEDASQAERDLLRQGESRSLAVEGLEPLVSTDFYEVDINNVNPTVDESQWSLSVTGAVEEDVEFDLDDLREFPREERFVTLRCVGDYLNGLQMDNALWSGVPVAELLDEAGTRGSFVMLRAWDSYYNELPLEALQPGLLADRMNGRPLPRGHGAPIRALVPGHWGEVNVKWLTEIEVLDRPAEGYWEKRGWEGTGPVKTVAKLRRTNDTGRGRVELAGHAYAGTRGIRAVEVSRDGGETWTEAELSEPLPGEDVWRQWRHAYTATESHEVVVRAIDDTGAVQIPEASGPRPDGATGWVSQEVTPR